MPVLVAHASDHGSTREIAERIATRLSEKGLAAEARPVDEADDPGGYDAVVLGSAVHSQAWLPEATRWARRHSAALAERPVWLFSVSLVGQSSSAFPRPVGNLVRKMKERRPPRAAVEVRQAIRPRGTHSFTGVIRPDHWGRLGRTVFKAMGGRWGDHRDWGEVDAWAAEVAAALETAGGSDSTT